MRRPTAGLLANLLTVGVLAAAEISYTLPAPGRVSLAVYDAAGRQVRTLLNAAPQTAGPRSVAWDGLDRDGRPVPPGPYGWRLVRSPGLRAEYLLALGTSVGIHHWPGQHGGPSMVAMTGDTILVGGNPEGSPALAGIKTDGAYQWAAPNIEASGVLDIAADGERLYFLQASGDLYALSVADGKRLRRADGKGALPPCQILLPLGAVPAIEPTRDKQRVLALPVPVADGSYLLRLTAGPATKQNPTLAVTVQNRWTGLYDVAPGKFRTQLVPEQYRWRAPAKAQDGKLTVTFDCHDKAPDVSWSARDMELLAPVTRVTAHAGAVAVLFGGAATVAWVAPDEGRVLAQAAVPGALDLALRSADELLVTTGKQVLLVRRGESAARVLIDGLEAADRVSVDHATGAVWLAERGARQQVRCFDRDGRERRAFGRLGGRLAGRYQPEDFRAVADICGDGQGGFVVVESESAPRRTAHFDRAGKLLAEWYGGQQFYTFAAPEPDNPSRVWMDSQWGWLMQVDVDWPQRSWRVRACYEWNRDLDPLIFPTGKMAQRMYPFRADLAGTGQQQPYLWFQGSGLVVRIDEPGGRMLPVAALGRMIPNQFWNWQDVAPERYPQAFKDALATRGRDWRKRDDVKGHLGYGWADADGDGQVQASELRLHPPEIHRNGHGFHGGPPCLWLDERMNRYAAEPRPNQPAWQVRAPVGRTAGGAPIWEWAGPTRDGPKLPFGGSSFLRLAADGSLYQLLRGGGDGFAAGLDSFHSHGAGWPGTLADRTGIVRYSPAGEVLWQVGTHAARAGAPAGQVHNPVAIAGFAQGCVAVCDYFQVPCHFWTEDGLYVGQLLDGRADDGLPPRIYSWWRADRSKGDEFDNLAAFQYDMLVGGSLTTLPGGEVVFLGAGWNNVPVFRVHGLDQLARQQGAVELASPARAAERQGTGLAASYFANATLAGEPARTQVEPSIWQPAPKKNWPDVTPGADGFSVRWGGQVEPRYSEPYTFALYLRGKARLWVDGKLALERWDKPATNEKLFAEPLALQAGRRYPLVLEFASGGVAQPEAHLCWESPTQGIEHVPSTALYPAEPSLRLSSASTSGSVGSALSASSIARAMASTGRLGCLGAIGRNASRHSISQNSAPSALTSTRKVVLASPPAAVRQTSRASSRG